MQAAAEPIRIIDWQGLVSNRGKLGGKPGQALVQTNLRVVKKGELALRNNAQSVTFVEGDAGGACNAMYPFHLEGTDYLVVSTTAGAVHALELP